MTETKTIIQGLEEAQVQLDLANDCMHAALDVLEAIQEETAKNGRQASADLHRLAGRCVSMVFITQDQIKAAQGNIKPAVEAGIKGKAA